ncbi:hypothetical protein BDA96_01G332200 [Sorghum bicolor]|uniref:Uncharacterized protein n=1 Tax=Sorghum bicolor TaxID=4558 RepID=A0A921S2E7_SORBI|nr:hypothetical protein BDA96_01G332200 [Sorghum bicolor]
MAIWIGALKNWGLADGILALGNSDDVQSGVYSRCGLGLVRVWCRRRASRHVILFTTCLVYIMFHIFRDWNHKVSSFMITVPSSSCN